MLTKQQAINVLTTGTLYYPAGSTHYGNFLANVCCDYCGRSQLKISIGENKIDICLPCADNLASAQSKHRPTNMTQPMTRMLQDSTKPRAPSYSDEEPMTFMLQDSTRPW